jgi:hypothetical protein
MELLLVALVLAVVARTAAEVASGVQVLASGAAALYGRPAGRHRLHRPPVQQRLTVVARRDMVEPSSTAPRRSPR